MADDVLDEKTKEEILVKFEEINQKQNKEQSDHMSFLQKLTT